ncbi:MAG TPA: hypothetical protein VHL34_14080 [Rhizomicrobium sp.]|nr:hypothetical protein [Rhizomicrobium sp.]
MKDPVRIDVMSKDTVVSIPLRLPRIFLPHIALVAVIITASTVSFILNVIDWVSTGF